MTWAGTSGVRDILTRGVAGGALLFGIAIGTAVPAGAEPPFGPPTGPDDTSCISQPADPACAGGPYALPAPPTIAPPPPPAPIMAPPISIPSPMMGGGMAGIGGMPGHI